MSHSRKLELMKYRLRRRKIRQYQLRASNFQDAHTMENAVTGPEAPDQDDVFAIAPACSTISNNRMCESQPSMTNMNKPPTTTTLSSSTASLTEFMDRETIFVSVASYRDPECSKTVEDLLRKAKNPKRISIGVCEQNHPEHDKHLNCRASSVAKQHESQIRTIQMSCFEATGPMLARAKIEQELYQGETFYLIIDSHTMFIQNWDAELIHELLMCPSEKPVLTCYPDDYLQYSHTVPPVMMKASASYLRFKNFHPQFGLSQQERLHFRNTPKRPVRSLFWAAGFSFTYGQVIEEVPYDPNYPYIFLGEEITMAARLYCAGWETFAPTKNMIFHLTSRNYRPTFWEQFYKKNSIVDDATRAERKQIEKKSQQRLHDLLQGRISDAVYGLKSTRSLSEFEEFVGLNFKDHSHQPHALLGLQKNADAEERMVKLGSAS